MWINIDFAHVFSAILGGANSNAVNGALAPQIAQIKLCHSPQCVLSSCARSFDTARGRDKHMRDTHHLQYEDAVIEATSNPVRALPPIRRSSSTAACIGVCGKRAASGRQFGHAKQRFRGQCASTPLTQVPTDDVVALEDTDNQEGEEEEQEEEIGGFTFISSLKPIASPAVRRSYAAPPSRWQTKKSPARRVPEIEVLNRMHASRRAARKHGDSDDDGGPQKLPPPSVPAAPKPKPTLEPAAHEVEVQRAVHEPANESAEASRIKQARALLPRLAEEPPAFVCRASCFWCHACRRFMTAKPFECMFCGRAYKSPGHLERQSHDWRRRPDLPQATSTRSMPAPAWRPLRIVRGTCSSFLHDSHVAADAERKRIRLAAKLKRKRFEEMQQQGLAQVRRTFPAEREVTLRCCCTHIHASSLQAQDKQGESAEAKARAAVLQARKRMHQVCRCCVPHASTVRQLKTGREKRQRRAQSLFNPPVTVPSRSTACTHSHGNRLAASPPAARSARARPRRCTCVPHHCRPCLAGLAVLLVGVPCGRAPDPARPAAPRPGSSHGPLCPAHSCCRPPLRGAFLRPTSFLPYSRCPHRPTVASLHPPPSAHPSQHRRASPAKCFPAAPCCPACPSSARTCGRIRCSSLAVHDMQSIA